MMMMARWEGKEKEIGKRRERTERLLLLLMLSVGR